jgi:uncharacterized PurR-regulated membrane protein YhhQ (DUF165 family)
MNVALLIAYVATIPLANWMIQNVGTVCVPNGPCLIPVGFGLMAPSGVLVIGAAFVLRDMVQRRMGAGMGFACILLGVPLAAYLAPPALVAASLASYFFSELADFAVYTPLARRRFVLAIVLSSAAASAVDSILFLWLAFGSLDHLAGQIVGKWMAVAAGAVIATSLRRRAFA